MTYLTPGHRPHPEALSEALQLLPYETTHTLLMYLLGVENILLLTKYAAKKR